MHTPSNPLSRNFDFFRNLSASTLAGSGDMVSWYLNHTQEFIGRSSKQLRDTLSSLGQVQKPERWAEAMGNGIRGILETSRDYAIQAADYQQESYRRLQQQALETQQTLSTSLAEQFTILQGETRQQRRSAKDTTLAQRITA